MDAPVLKIVRQRHQSDCSVACLAMACGVSYENALVAVAAAGEPDVCVRGVWMKHIKAAAKLLGFRARVKRRFDLADCRGILCVRSAAFPTQHLVIARDGVIIDTDATLWDVDVYFAQGVEPLELYQLERIAS